MSGGVLDATYAHDRLQKPEVRFRYRIRARIVAEAVRRYLGRAEQVRVLDLGSAEGRALQELQAMLPNSTFCGVERSAELIAEAPSLPKSIQLYCGDVTSLPGELEGPFDVVSALAVLEHLSTPQDAVREGAKVLRSGGIFVASCPSPTWDHVAARLGAAHDDAHEVELDRGAMIALAQEAGLEVLSFERFMLAPVAFLPYLRIPVSPGVAMRSDRFARSLRLLDFLFVNQALIARKP